MMACSPADQANALREFAATQQDAELTFTTNDGGIVYLVRKDGLLFARSKHLDE